LVLIQVLDDVERALAASGAAAAGNAEEPAAGAAADPIVTGLRLIRGRIGDHLRRFGVAEIEAAGIAFDPHVHEAVMQAPAAGVAPGHVAQVLERGYRLNDRVLRPARVVVASTEPA
jgi:molecular chaperone GrpE